MAKIILRMATDARHAAFLEDSLSLLADFSRQHAVERAVAITQQHWDEKIGELAGITRNANHSQVVVI